MGRLLCLVLWVGCRSEGLPRLTAEAERWPASYDELSLPESEDLDPDPGVVEVRLGARPVEIAPAREPPWRCGGTPAPFPDR